jgi:two-component system cell cycle sensor histidine kinase/response regulator CckA
MRPRVGGSEAGDARRLRTVDDLRTGDNAAFIYANEQEHKAVLVPFVRAGLEQRERVIYIHDRRSPQTVAALLAEGGMDVDLAQAMGQLVFVPARQMYARGAGYAFDAVLDKMHAMTAMALADGWMALRVTTEMSWALRQTQGTERLLEQAGRLGTFFRESAALGLSQFERNLFPADALLDVLLAHPVAVLGTEAAHNFYYTPQVEVSGKWRSEATLDKWISNLKERKRSAENLREALQLHREVLGNLGSGIVVISRDGRVVQCNPFMEKLLGVVDLDLQGRRLAEFFPDLGADTFEEALERVLAGEVVLSPDMVVNRPGKDEPLWAIATLAPYRNPDGHIIGAIGVVSDISSRKQMEDALRASEEHLRQTQKLEAVGRLAGGVAHDMNNALNAIIAFADLALQQIDEDEDLQADIGEIRAAAERAAGITRRLLAFSRRQVLQIQVVELNAIVASVEGMLQRLIGDRVGLTLRLSPDVGRVKTDPAQIEQVIINLALNARDAMIDGGTLCIETDVVRLEVEERGVFDSIGPGEYAVLRISDSGCGMSPDVLAHAFEPFFTTKDTSRGSGLGLPVVYGIVKQSGGQIRVRSQLDEGTSVEVFLARSMVDSRSDMPAANVAGSETVLLVEDEDLVRKVVARILRGAGYRVLVAADGVEALSICEDNPPTIHLLVTDVVMPGIGGKELAARLAGKFPDVKVLFMTGYTDDEVLRRGILDQGRALILKPFSPEELLRRIRMVLSSQ